MNIFNIAGWFMLIAVLVNLTLNIYMGDLKQSLKDGHWLFWVSLYLLFGIFSVHPYITY